MKITLKDGSEKEYNEALSVYDVAKDMIISIRQIKKDSYINSATVESTSIDDELYLVISHSDSEYDGMKFDFE